MNPYFDHRAAQGTQMDGSWLILSRSLSLLGTLSSLWLSTQKFVQRFPLGSGIPGFPYRTNELVLLSALWNCPLSLRAHCHGLGAGPLEAYVVGI